MGSELSTGTIHEIDASPEYKEELLIQFRKIDEDNDSLLSKAEFEKLIKTSIPKFLPFSELIFLIFSDDGKNIRREKFIDFCDSMQLLVRDLNNQKSLVIRVFRYLDKNHNDYLGVSELHTLQKLIYQSISSQQKVKKSDSEKLMKSLKPSSLKGLSVHEFIRMFREYHPFKSSQQTKTHSFDKGKDAKGSQGLRHLRRMSSLSEIILPSENLISYESPNPKKLDEKTIKLLKDDFLTVDVKNKGLLNQKGLIALLQIRCIVPTSYAKLITEIFGENHYINFDGYRDLIISFRLKKDDSSSFWKKVFNHYDTEKKKYLTINQCIAFGRDIGLNEIANSRQCWNARLKECRTIYHYNNINFEYFHQIMFSLQ